MPHRPRLPSVRKVEIRVPFITFKNFIDFKGTRSRGVPVRTDRIVNAHGGRYRSYHSTLCDGDPASLYIYTIIYTVRPRVSCCLMHMHMHMPTRDASLSRPPGADSPTRHRGHQRRAPSAWSAVRGHGRRVWPQNAVREPEGSTSYRREQQPWMSPAFSWRRRAPTWPSVSLLSSRSRRPSSPTW